MKLRKLATIILTGILSTEVVPAFAQTATSQTISGQIHIIDPYYGHPGGVRPQFDSTKEPQESHIG
jgi:hypothetical protein